MMVKNSEYKLKLTDVISKAWNGSSRKEPDYIDFAWWSDTQLQEFANSRKAQTLSSFDLEMLHFEMERRGFDTESPQDEDSQGT